MVHASDLAALLEGRHADPFAVLGPHRDAAGTWWIRAWMPGATTVDAIDARSGRTLARLRARGDHGFFEAACPTATVERPDYRLRVHWHHGATTESRDAYAFGPLIAHDDLHALRDGRHPRPYTVLGAHPLRVDDTDGVRFAVWAPNASRVSVVGDFNAWDGRRHPMRVRHDAGVWELFVPHVACGDRYKFEVRTRDGAVLALKADPYAFASELRPATASVVARLPDARPLPSDRAHANSRSAPMSIYEVHLGSWRRTADGGFLSWDTLAQTLPGYVADLGFTHVELLPITEHPFDGSWGYQTLGLYAPTARFGTPDGFARFIDACRAHGLGVLIDWVPAHFPADVHGLAHFDGTALYEYADPREGFHRDWNTLIYHFGRHEVRNFLVGSALYWIERFGIDGLRVDAVASMLYRDYSRPAGEWIPNVHGGRENLEAIAMLKRTNEVIGTEAPGAITVAEESTAFPGVSHPTYAGGLGFHYKWNMGWMHDTLAYMAHDPVHRKWHHDKLTFGLVYAFSENFVLPLSHDEVVHGKGSLIGKMPGDRWQKFANLRAYFGFMWTHPGKKLLFMGGEFAQEREWNHDTALDWALLDRAEHRGVQHLVRDLNRLYASRAALHRRDCDASGFTWVEASDADRSLLAYLRWGDDPRDVVLVVCNFTPVPRHDVTLGVPDVAGARGWREVLNTDAAIYAGSNVGNASGVLPIARHASHGQPCALRLTAPPLATVVLEPSF